MDRRADRLARASDVGGAERRAGRADAGTAHADRRAGEAGGGGLGNGRRVARHQPARPRRALHGRRRRRGSPGQGHDVGAQGHLRPQLRVRRRRRLRPGRRRDRSAGSCRRPAGRGWSASAARRTTPTSTSISGSTARRSAGSASSPPSRGASPSSTSSARSTCDQLRRLEGLGLPKLDLEQGKDKPAKDKAKDKPKPDDED